MLEGPAVALPKNKPPVPRFKAFKAVVVPNETELLLTTIIVVVPPLAVALNKGIVVEFDNMSNEA
jgi:hypothetical protein